MRNLLSLRGLLLLLLVVPFLSCQIEPVTGEFPQAGPNSAGEGQFIAKIGGQEFVADQVDGKLSVDNILSLNGIKFNGEIVGLSISNPAIGTFSLTTTGVNQNGGAYMDGVSLMYTTFEMLGGSGQVDITMLDVVNNKVSGTFSFIGVRMKIGDDGMPIMDGSGEPIVEKIEVTNGAFTEISFINDSGGGGEPVNEFFAKVDGEDFLAYSISVTGPVVGDIPMYKIEARTAARVLISIEIPESIGEGTFSMESISNGNELIGIYNEGNGNLTSNPGTITISEFNVIQGVLKAEFAFTAADPLGENPNVVEITEGSFTVYF